MSIRTSELRRLLRSLGCEQTPGVLRGMQRHLARDFGPDWIEKEQAR